MTNAPKTCDPQAFRHTLTNGITAAEKQQANLEQEPSS